MIVNSFRVLYSPGEIIRGESQIHEPIEHIDVQSMADSMNVRKNEIPISMAGMKTYRNEKHGFEIDIPENWSPPPAITYGIASILFGQSSPVANKDIFQYGCAEEAFNIEIGPLFPEPLLNDTEIEFRLYARDRGFTDLRFSRITVAGREHVCASYFINDNMGKRWNKKYMIVFGGVEYTLTGTCNDAQWFVKREKDWDAIVQTFRVIKPVDDSANFSAKADKDREQRQGIIQKRIEMRETLGDLYARAYEAVALENYKEARELLEKCLQNDPNHIMAHKELAVVLKKLGDKRGALAHRREVKRLDPSDMVNRHNLASLLEELGERDASKREINELQTMGPEQADKITRFQKGMSHIMRAIALREGRNGTQAGNLKSAIGQYQQALEWFTRQDHPEEWVSAQIDLGETYRHLSLIGDLDDNLEQAISHYEQALEVGTHEQYPELWAAAHNNLGIAYANGKRGDRTEKVEMAIFHCQQALEFYTRATHPDDWAMTQNNLGGAYRKCIKGDRAENIEQAISCFQCALEVQDHQPDRGQWAGTHNNLTLAYWERVRGERADNLEKVIFHAQKALEVYTFESHPRDWAFMHTKLSAAYQVRIRGDQAENLEHAIRHVELALKVFNRHTDPENWAKAQNNLALAFQLRKRGDHAKNIEQAISYFLQALQVFTIQAFPAEWAATQNYLAYAYRDRLHGDPAENKERAIDCFRQSLQVFTRETYPEQYAATHNGLKFAFIDRKRGDRGENIEQAIHHNQQEMEVRDRASHPQDWAMCQVFLGYATLERKRGAKAEYTEQAARYFQQALEVFTREAYPEGWAQVQEGLSLVEKERGSEGRESQGVPVNIPARLTYPDLYDIASRQHTDKKHFLKLIYSDVPEIKYATSLLLVYQWEGELSEEEADRLRLRTAVYLACAIYDAARVAGLPCALSPILNGQRPTWMIEGEKSPISLTLSDTGKSDRTLQMSIGPIVVSVDKLPVNKVPMKKLMEGFRERFSEIVV